MFNFIAIKEIVQKSCVMFLVACFCAPYFSTLMAQDAEVEKLLERYRKEPSVINELKGMRVGKIGIHPYLNENVSYEDNIFLRKHNRQSDTIIYTEQVPGPSTLLKLSIKFRRRPPLWKQSPSSIT